MKTNKNQWQDDAALKRYTMIAPLLDSSIDNARRVALRKKVAEDNNTTIRSLYRYEKAYRKDGFAGLRPSNREKQRSQALPDNFQELLSEAVQLRREVPNARWSRSSLFLSWRTGWRREYSGVQLWNGIFSMPVLGRNTCALTKRPGKVLPDGSASRTG